MFRKILLTILTITWMLVIYGMSNEPAPISGGRSEAVSRFVCERFVPSYDTMSPDNQLILVKKLEYVIRKCAHMTEYAILGVLLCVTLMAYGVKKLRGLLSLVIGVLYASSDEIHQLFISGRSGQLTDVMIDSIGLAIGISIAVLCIYFSCNHRETPV